MAAACRRDFDVVLVGPCIHSAARALIRPLGRDDQDNFSMLALIISLVVLFVFRLVIFFFVAEPGISLQVSGTAILFSKNTLTIALWAFRGFPAVAASVFVLWERRRSRANGQNK